MIKWQDEGLVLASRPHGETAAIVSLFTRDHGRHLGVMRGGSSRKHAAMLQPGSQVNAQWSARLEEHLGQYRLELTHSRAHLADDRLTLAAMVAICATLDHCLPERDPYRDFYRDTQQLLSALDATPDWPLLYVQWERALLGALGFGLDLTHCAVLGTTEDLRYISPRTGRAVSEMGAGDWGPRLFSFSPALLGGKSTLSEISAAFGVTGHFLAHHITPDRPLPSSRARLLDAIAQMT